MIQILAEMQRGGLDVINFILSVLGIVLQLAGGG
jgi:hypothetical protein